MDILETYKKLKQVADNPEASLLGTQLEPKEIIKAIAAAVWFLEQSSSQKTKDWDEAEDRYFRKEIRKIEKLVEGRITSGKEATREQVLSKGAKCESLSSGEKHFSFVDNSKMTLGDFLQVLQEEASASKEHRLVESFGTNTVRIPSTRMEQMNNAAALLGDGVSKEERSLGWELYKAIIFLEGKAIIYNPDLTPGEAGTERSADNLTDTSKDANLRAKTPPNGREVTAD